MRTIGIVAIVLVLGLIGVILTGEREPSSPRPHDVPMSPEPEKNAAPPVTLPSTEPSPSTAPPASAELKGVECDVPSPAIAKALVTKKVKITFDRTPLETAVDYLERCLGETIRFPRQIYEERTGEECEVSLELQDVTVRVALDRVTKAVGQIWWIEGGEIRIGGWLPESMYHLRDHDLTQLLHQGVDGDAVADAVRDGVDSTVWNRGGEVFVRDEKAALRVKAPPSTHARVERLLATLLAEAKAAK